MGILQDVLIDDYKTYEDWGIILKHKEISSPTPQIKRVSVIGRNGDIDYTEVVTGDVRYNNREVKMDFKIVDMKFEDAEAKRATIVNAIHGKKVKITFDDDLAFYWLGRIEVSAMTPSNGVNPAWEFSMVANVDPYKYSIVASAEDWLWDPFDFETDIINETANMEVKTGELFSVTLNTIDDDRISSPVIISDSSKVKVSVFKIVGREAVALITGETLKKGSQVIYDLVLEASNRYRFDFTNEGSEDAVVTINYVGGML